MSKSQTGKRRALRGSVGTMNRREFLARIAALGATLGAPPLLSSCGGDASAPPPQQALQRRLLFFNLSRTAGPAPANPYLHIAGKRLPLTPVAQAPEVLQQARRSNAFLQALPDAAITHHLDAELPAKAVALGYVSADEDPASGNWTMPLLHLLLPESAHALAFAAGAARLPRSAKRRFYGMPAAASAAELIDEAAFIDSHDHAQALVGVHTELLCLDPGGAAYLHANHIAPNPDMVQLVATLAGLGPAAPQQSASQPNPGQWATLRPLLDRRVVPPVPYRKSDGKLIQFMPDWHPDVDAAVAQCIRTIHPGVIDDENLGVALGAGSVVQSAEAVRGRLWFRHDGLASVARRQAQAGEDVPTVTFSSLATETGLAVSAPTVENVGGRVQVTMDNVSNWFLRWLGMWIKFRAPGDGDKPGRVIPTSSLDADTLPDAKYPHSNELDTAESLFVGMLPEVNALAGIPFMPGKFEPVIRWPQGAASMEVIYGGLGLSGALNDPEKLRTPGIVATVLVNYVIVSIFLAAGVQDLDETGRLLLDLLAQGLLELLLNVFEALLARETLALEELVAGMCKTIMETGATTLLDHLWKYLFDTIGRSEVIDSIPILGQAARAVAAVIGAVELAETTLEIGLSPPLYRFNLVLTHDLSTSFTVDPDFLKSWSSYSLYYKVSYVFDSGSAHVLAPIDLPAAAAGAPVAVKLSGIPFGGQVNVLVGIYARAQGAAPGANDLCAAHGSTGLIANTVDTAPAIALAYNRVPISAATVYLHSGISSLDASGAHAWRTGLNGGNAPPYLPPTGDQQPSLGALRGITVRQGAGALPGYVGYAWQGYSSGVPGCGSGVPGQFDYVAILDTATGAAGAARPGFVASSCGSGAGTLASFSLLSDQSRNVMLEPESLLLRPVALGSAPALPGPGTGGAFGRLNLPPTRLLLHPAGYAVSINSENHKIEALKLPQQAVDDATARSSWLARHYSGFGTRPGLMDTPVALAISADGVILVLEDSSGNNRIQAFDVGGNPIPYFTKQKRPHFLQLDATQNATYLDLAVEYGGFLYVLSQDASNVHWLDVYHPDQEGTAPICRTSGINAARMTVDFWRTVYTLNYDILRSPDGSIPALTEPSVSFWTPSTTGG